MKAAKRAKISKDDLPNDMLIDILLRLPTKSLSRFRCVSKQWSNLMLDTDFVRAYHDKYLKVNLPGLIYYERSPGKDPTICMNLDEESDYEWFPEGWPIVKETHSLIIMDGNGMIRDKFELSLEGLEGYGDINVIPSGHELICLRRGKGDIFVCNPNTHELVKLPKPCGKSIRTESLALTYIPSASEYKLVHLIHIRYEEDDLVLHTFCWICDIRNDGKSGSNSWRWIPARFPHPYPWLMDVVENVDGTVYWWNKTDNGQKRQKGKIISLDMEEEDFLMIDEPIECSGNFVSLVGLKGQLSLAHAQGSATTTMNIWTLTDPKNSLWAKEYSINLPSWNALPLHVGEREMMLFERLSKSSVLSYYNMQTKTLRNRNILLEYKKGPYIYYGGLFPLGSSHM